MKTPQPDPLRCPGRLVYVPFSKTECGTDFYVNTGHSREISGVLTEYETFRTDFFEFFFFRKARGYLLLETRKLELADRMALVVSPRQQQEWHVDEAGLDYDFLIFREDFLQTFVADKFFTYRLLYCYQTDTPPCLPLAEAQLSDYCALLARMKAELLHPVADSYHLIVSLLPYLLMLLNRAYAACYALPFDVPRDNHAFLFKELLERHIRQMQRVGEYADRMRVSRAALNRSVKAQFGVSAAHLLKQRLLAALKSEWLFSGCNVNQLADMFRFSDASHLMRFFKQQTGKTLSQYRQDYRDGIYD